MSPTSTLGSLTLVPATERPDLLAAPVKRALADAGSLAAQALVAEIDPSVSDTPNFIEMYAVPPVACANCVVVAGRREGVERVAACLVPATTRADVNVTVKRLLDVRKCSFLPMDRAVAETGMEYGGITPLGLPEGWRLLVDARVIDVPLAVMGSGVRHGKLAFPGTAIATFPRAEVIEGLAVELAAP